MIEEWIVSVGGRIRDSIYDHQSLGGGLWGYASIPGLRLRYSWEELHIGYEPTFDRWANSRDWEGQLPTSQEQLTSIVADVLRRGSVGEFGHVTK